MAEQNQVEDVNQDQLPVAEREGFEGFADIPSEVDPKTGRQRITIAPVITPKPSPETLQQEVSPITAVTEATKTAITGEQPAIVKAATEELESRPQQQNLSIDNLIERLKSGEKVTVGDKVYAKPHLMLIDKNSPNYKPQARLKVMANISRQNKAGTTDEPAIAFTDPTTTQVQIPPSITDPQLIDAATLYAQNRMKVNDYLRPVVRDPNVRQLFVDEYISNSMTKSLLDRLAEQGRFFVNGPTYLGVAGNSAWDAMIAADRKGTSFLDEWNSRAPEREETNRRILDGIDEVLSGPTLAMHFNNEIRRVAKERLDNGSMTEDEYNAIVYERVGDELVEKNHITEEVAYGLLDLSFGNLNNSEQIGVYALEFGLTGGIYGGHKARQGKQELKKLKDLMDAPQNKGLLEGVTDYNEALRLLKNRDTDIALNKNLIDVGIRQETLTNEFKRLQTDIDSAEDTMRALEFQGLQKSVDYQIAKSKRDNLYRLKIRSILRSTTPYVKETAKDAAIASFGTWAAYTYLPEYTGLSPEVSEVIGFLGMTVVGGTDLTKWTATKAKNITGSAIGLGEEGLRFIPTGGSVDNSLGLVNSFIRFGASRANPLIDTTLSDYERLVFVPTYGRQMSFKERRTIKRAMRAGRETSPENKEKMFQAWDSYEQLAERLTTGMDEADKLQANNFLDMSIGSLTGVSFVKAGDNLRKLQKKAVTKNGFDFIFDAHDNAFEKFDRLEMLVKNFENNILNKYNPDDVKPIRDFVSKISDAVNTEKARMQNELAFLEANFEAYVDTVTASMSEDLSRDYLQNMIQSGIELDSRLGKVADEEKVIKRAIAGFNSGMQRRLERIEIARDNKTYRSAKLGRAVEDMLLQQLNKITAEGDAAYSNLRQWLDSTNRPGIDISAAVQRMMELSGESDIQMFFGKDGMFFNSPVGRKAQIVFNRMVKRQMDELGEGAYQALQQDFIEALVEAGDYATPEDAAKFVQTLKPFELGLLAHQSGEINIFGKVKLDEADVIRRAFRDYGYRVTDKEFGSKFKEFAKLLDDTIQASDEEGFKKLMEARAIYADVVGDATREGGTFYKLKKSQQGAEKIAQDPDSPFGFFYKTDTPLTVFKPLTDNVSKLVRVTNDRERTKSAQNLQKAVSDIATAFAGRVNNQPVFRLHDSQDLSNFKTLQKLVNLYVYDQWAADYIASVRSPRTGAVVDPKQTYDFTRSEKLDFVEQNAMVLVQRTPDSKPVRIPLVDLKAIYNLESKILSEMDEGEEYYKAFETFMKKTNAELKVAKVELKTTMQLQQQGMEVLSVLSKTSEDVTGRQFFDSYIAGTGEDLYVLRDKFIETMRTSPSGNKYSIEETEELFDKAVTSLVFRALKTYGGYSKLPEQANRMRGGKYSMGMYTDTASLLSILGDADVRQRLSLVMDNDQISYLYDIADYMHLQNVKTVAVDGGLRGMTPNQIMSHVYNNARGMVSPLWSSTDIAIRLMSENNIDLMLLALENKDAARIMRNMMAYPELITPQDVDIFGELVESFLITQLTLRGQEAVVQDYLEMLEERKVETNENE